LLAPLYAVTLLAVSLSEGSPLRRSITEPLVMLALFWGLLLWFR